MSGWGKSRNRPVASSEIGVTRSMNNSREEGVCPPLALEEDVVSSDT